MKSILLTLPYARWVYTIIYYMYMDTYLLRMIEHLQFATLKNLYFSNVGSFSINVTLIMFLHPGKKIGGIKAGCGHNAFMFP